MPRGIDGESLSICSVVAGARAVAAPFTISKDPPISVSDAALQRSLRTWIDDRGIGLTENAPFLILTPLGIGIARDLCSDPVRQVARAALVQHRA